MMFDVTRLRDISKEERWHDGWNIGRFTHYQVSPQSGKGTFFKIRMVNLFYQEMHLAFFVPEDRDVHQLLKDIFIWYKHRQKPWIEILLSQNSDRRSGMTHEIIGINEIQNPKFEELEQISLDLRSNSKLVI
jgi:hypothetical protein